MKQLFNTIKKPHLTRGFLLYFFISLSLALFMMPNAQAGTVGIAVSIHYLPPLIWNNSSFEGFVDICTVVPSINGPQCVLDVPFSIASVPA
ncbi:MAG: hypothetical protein ABSD27_15255, partial [Bryobacteraceae bacterium]